MGDDLLRAQGHARGLFGGERESLVEAVGVEGLGSSENGSKSLEGGADDVVLWLLRREGGTGGLGYGSEHP